VAKRGLVDRVAAPVRAGRALPRTDGNDDTRPVACPDDRVLRLGRTVHEIPLTQRPLLALDDQQRLTDKDEEVLLVGLPVVHRHRLARAEDADVDSDLRELRLALEQADRRAPFLVHPAGLARVEYEPALTLRDEPLFRRLERRLGNHRRGP
jgi:hypothetical protein